jgi:hypothetical protein
MILKVIRAVSSGQEYWIFDCIKKISVSSTKNITRINYFLDGNVPHDHDEIKKEPSLMDIHDITLIDNFAANENLEENKYKVLICRDADTGTEFSIAFDTVAYLCNDEGKTIEKIVP